MSKRLSNHLERQNKIWKQTQEKRRRLIKRSAATTMATALIAAKLMTPASAVEASSTYTNEISPQSEVAMLVDDSSDEMMDETMDDISDEMMDDEISDENTDGISDYSMYDFSDEYSDEIQNEWDTDERVFDLRTDRTNMALLRVDREFYFVNDERARLDAPPMIEEGRTILPVRFIAQAMGAEVLWDAEDRRVTIQKGDDMIELWIDSNLARVNGDFQLVDPDNDSVRAKIIPGTGRTMVPVRFVAETLGAEVFWDEATKTISFKY